MQRSKRSRTRRDASYSRKWRRRRSERSKKRRTTSVLLNLRSFASKKKLNNFSRERGNAYKRRGTITTALSS